MGVVMNRLLAAVNARDVEAFVACVAPDHRSDE